MVILLIGSASADVQMSNTYYTEGAIVQNDVFLHNIDYTNHVEIFPGSLFVDGSGINSPGSSDGRFTDNTFVGSHAGPISANLGISAESLSYAKGLSANLGDGEVGYSYTLNSGVEDAGFSNRVTEMREHLLSLHNSYSARFNVTQDDVSFEGHGNRFSFEDLDSIFRYNLYVSHNGRWVDTDAYLSAMKIKQADVTPVVYMWNTSIGNKESDSTNHHFDMAFVAGDRTIDAMIRGTNSNGLELTVPVSGIPWHVDPIPAVSGSNNAETLNDLIKLIRQGIVNSGHVDWTL